MIIERPVFQRAPPKPEGKDLLRDLANDALLVAQGRADAAEAALVQANRDKEDAIRAISRERDDALSAAAAAAEKMGAAMDQLGAMQQSYEDADSARIAAESGLEIANGAVSVLKESLDRERMARAQDAASITNMLSSIDTAGSNDGAGWEIRVTGRDELGRLLALKLTKEKP